MATAKSGTRTKTIEVQVPVINLELTELEASTLMAVARSVAGGTQSSPRGYMDRIRIALSEAGVDHNIESALIGKDSLSAMLDDPGSVIRFRPYGAIHGDRKPVNNKD